MVQIKVGDKRTYIIPLRREWLKVPRWRRSKRAVDALHSYLEKHTKVENVKITIQGKDIVFDEVKQVIEDLGGTIHSIDKVSTGTVIVEEAQTHQDSPH